MNPTYKRPLAIVILILNFLFFFNATGQTYKYTNREASFNRGREQSKLIVQRDGKYHLWRWGNGDVVLNVYDKQLDFLYSQKISKESSERVSFILFKGFYYVWLRSFKREKFFQVKEYTCTNISVKLSKLQLQSIPSTSQIAQSDNFLFFIQQDYVDPPSKSYIYATVSDSQLHYITTLRFEVIPPKPYQPPNLSISATEDNLFVINTKFERDTSYLVLYKTNIVAKKVDTATLFFAGSLFVPVQFQFYGNGFLLNGLTQSGSIPWWQNTHSSSTIKLDSNLKVVSGFYSGVVNEETVALPNNTLLTISYNRVVNAQSHSTESQLLCYLLDSELNILRHISKLLGSNTSSPVYLFRKQKDIIIFYEEWHKPNQFLIHNFLLAKEDDDRVLLLRSNLLYLLEQAVAISDNTFVMPYLYKYGSIGLVQVTVP